jgi:GTPase SAR1 family protein
MICFSVVDQLSFQNVKYKVFCKLFYRIILYSANINLKWHPEVCYYSSYTPYILIGTKIDLRDNKEEIEKLKNQNQKPIEFLEGFNMMKKINAEKYFGKFKIFIFFNIIKIFLRMFCADTKRLENSF